jgi:hypothetical protein
MRRPVLSSVSLGVALLLPTAMQAHAEEYGGFQIAATVVASGPCVNTTVRLVAPRLDGEDPAKEHFTRADFISSGVAVTFNTKIGQPSGKSWAQVVHYQQEAGNDIMMAERIGDRVRVCFLRAPKAEGDCDPKTDGRGREFSVYDYRQDASYSGMNSEHGCGGA